MIDVNDFLTQTLAAIAAAIVMLAVQPDWVRRPDKVARTSSSAGGNHNHGGNQAILSDNRMDGSVQIDQQYTDNSQRTTIVNNVNRSTGASATSDELGKGLLIVAVALVAAVLFVMFRPLLQAISFGALTAVTVMLVVAVIRAQRLQVWTARGIITIVFVGVTFVLMFVTWTGVGTLQREGLSIDVISAAIPPIPAEQSDIGFPGYSDYFFNTVSPAFFGTSSTVVPFVLCLMVAAMAEAGLVVFAWLLVLDWHAFLSFNRGSAQKPRLVARAKSFNEGGVARIVLFALIIGAIAVVCANGASYDLWLNLQQEQKLTP